ncbi:glycogen debranching N-terminal domain-containing protein [Fischerella thermalis]|uniref:glycogen debranching N-terminal domain-containing protein n=1 Tax=Fischerella thermalis TaxID=372787 RepID=UPI0035713780
MSLISVGSPILTINHGSTFMVTDLNGHIHHEGHQGIFCKVMWKLSSKVGSLGV